MAREALMVGGKGSWRCMTIIPLNTRQQLALASHTLACCRVERSEDWAITNDDDVDCSPAVSYTTNSFFTHSIQIRDTFMGRSLSSPLAATMSTGYP
jgi:hypothetical protein